MLFSRTSLIRKLIQVGSSTLMSRCLGLVREAIMSRFLGLSALSDAFIVAFRIPNSLRKAFAEGALSAAMVPTIVGTMRSPRKKEGVSSLITLGFIIFEGTVLALCALTMWQAIYVVRFFAPGFSAEQIAQTVLMLRILMPFIFFISSSALLAGALESDNRFLVPALSPVLLNIVFIAGLIVCSQFDLPITVLCWFIVTGGALQFLAHLCMYGYAQFDLGRWQREDLKKFGSVLLKFAACLPSVSIIEISLMVDSAFASYLPKGSISLYYYANRFMGIPLGVFAVAFSTILLPQFSRVGTYAPKRLGFYVFEATKLIFWVTVPASLIMMFFSKELFYTIFLSSKFSAAQASQGGLVLVAFLIGLFFFSVNKVLISAFYALHMTWLPAIVSCTTALINFAFNYFFVQWLQLFGLAFATTLSGLVGTILFLFLLHRMCGLTLYISSLIRFVLLNLVQLVCTMPFLWSSYTLSVYAIKLLPDTMQYLLLHTIALWAWVMPLCGAYAYLLYKTRKQFGLHLYFLKQEGR